MCGEKHAHKLPLYLGDRDVHDLIGQDEGLLNDVAVLIEAMATEYMGPRRQSLPGRVRQLRWTGARELRRLSQAKHPIRGAHGTRAPAAGTRQNVAGRTAGQQ
ncbi:hypothetical protein SATRM34S_00085 [Streptomyces atroolivaceus]